MEKLFPRVHYLRYMSIPLVLPRGFWMKISITFLLFSILGLQLVMANDGYGQGLEDEMVTLEFKGEILSQVLKEIEKQTEYRFAYNTNQVQGYLVNLERGKRNLVQTLDLILSGKPLQYKVVKDKFIVVSPVSRKKEVSIVPRLLTYQLPSQVLTIPPINVEGQVTDQNGEPLIGVNVQVKGTNKGTATDFEGKFSLQNINENAVLVVSYIGYENQEIALAGKTTVFITMIADSQLLDEVVIVGYGTMKKENMTGSVSTVTAKKIENRPITNAATALQGVSPGLVVTRQSGQPGNEDIKVQVRGVTSINGDVDPLLILDGISVPVNTLHSINPNDIANISVLKDAAAAAVYGAQASGGVILVTTKKGEKGKTVFNYSNLFGSSKFIHLPERSSLLEEMEYSNISFKNAGLGRAYSDADFERVNQGITSIIHPSDSNRYISFDPMDPAKQTVRSRTNMQTHNFSVRGGSEDFNFHGSLGYYNQQGAFKVGPDQYERYNARINLQTKLTKHLSFNSNVSYSVTERESPSRSVSSLLGLSYRYRSRYPIFTPEGRLSAEGGTSAANKPYAYLKEGGYNNENSNTLNGVFTVSAVDLIDGLRLRAIYGGQYNRRTNEIFERTVTLWGRFTPILKLNVPNELTQNQLSRTNNNLQFLADYNFNITNDHQFVFLGGYQFEESIYNLTKASAANLINNDLPILQLGDDATKQNSQSISEYAYQSGFARMNYSYQSKYVLEATVRVDESSRLAPGLRTKVFPSVSGSWNMHNENWLAESSIFSRLKLRASWGQLGSALGSGIGNYDFVNRLERGNALVLGSPEIRQTYYFQNEVPSNSLTWETVETMNSGVDLGFFSNKLQFSADYYVKYNRNMLTPVKLPATYGVGSSLINNGELKSWGWEIEMNYRNSLRNDLNYSFGFNVADNQNKLLSYEGQRTVEDWVVPILEGYPYRSLWGFKGAGLFQTEEEVENWAFQDARNGPGDQKYMDLNGDGVINIGGGTPDDPGDLVYLGTDQPRFNFGVTGGLEWKGFDFSFFLQGVGERVFFIHLDLANGQKQAWEQPLKVHLDYWSEDNRDAFFPRPYVGSGHNFKNSDKWLLDGAYVRLKNVQLGYALPDQVTSRLGMSNIRVFFSGQDLFTLSGMGIWKNSINPEFPYRVNWSYPMTSTVSMGLNITF